MNLLARVAKLEQFVRPGGCPLCSGMVRPVDDEVLERMRRDPTPLVCEVCGREVEGRLIARSLWEAL